MEMIEVAQYQVEDLKNFIQDEEPRLFKLETNLDARKELLTKAIEESTNKKEKIRLLTSEQNEKLENLRIISDQINAEKADSDREKDTAIKLADRMTNKDITELNSYSQPPDAISLCMKAIMMLFDEEKEVKNKDELSNWFFACKSKLLKNISSFKEKLKESQTQSLWLSYTKILHPVVVNMNSTQLCLYSSFYQLI
jgi:outer membrane phospholipase A